MRMGQAVSGRRLPSHPRERDSDLTATVLMNGTYAEVLPLCREAFTVMLGPSTPASPVLFDHGIDALAGSLIVDPAGTLLAVSQGATYRDLKGVSKWTWIK